MNYTRATAGFNEYPDGKLASRAAVIVAAMDNNESFRDCDELYNRVKAATIDYRLKYQRSLQGSSRDKAEKRESKRILADLLQELAFYVNSVAKGDLVILRSSGFPILESKGKGTFPDTPARVRILDGRNSGEINVVFDPVGRDMQYEYCITDRYGPDGELAWGEIHLTTRSFKNYHVGLTPGRFYYVKIRAR
jgi:hypothetical protein